MKIEVQALDSQLLTAQAVAKKLGMSVAGVIKLAERGDLPFTRTSGGHRVFLRADVERLRRKREEK